MDFVTSLLDIIHGAFKISNTILWGLPMIVLLVGTHIYMTIRTKGIQRKIISAIKFSISKDEKGHGDVSQSGRSRSYLLDVDCWYFWHGNQVCRVFNSS